MFIQGDNFKVRDSITRPSVYPTDENRFTVICDDEIDNSSVEPPVAENDGKQAVNGKPKNI
jgi:hypothetical protein